MNLPPPSLEPQHWVISAPPAMLLPPSKGGQTCNSHIFLVPKTAFFFCPSRLIFPLIRDFDPHSPFQAATRRIPAIPFSFFFLFFFFSFFFFFFFFFFFLFFLLLRFPFFLSPPSIAVFPVVTWLFPLPLPRCSLYQDGGLGLAPPHFFAGHPSDLSLWFLSRFFPTAPTALHRPTSFDSFLRDVAPPCGFFFFLYLVPQQSGSSTGRSLSLPFSPFFL